ncbi:MAG: translation initiation factor [Myxococcota bacterium]|nr:translation initiation factor [Myxococcota bacterium]
MASDPKKPSGGSSPFASLASLRDVLPEGPALAPAAGPEPLPSALSPFRGKLVVERTRKGRGGKTVTVISGIVADAPALDEIARELRQALGCGAVAEGDQIVVQGEQGPRVRAFLESRGAKRIVIGS